MKKLIILTLVTILLSVTFIPALAAGGESRTIAGQSGTAGKQLYAIAGYIRDIDDDELTVTVEVLVGNRIGKRYLGQEIVLQVTPETRLLISGGIPIPFSYFAEDQPVSSNGILSDVDNDGDLDWTATRITVGAVLLNQ